MFKHSPLSEKPYAFRLIQLLPASDTGQGVSCELVSSDLEELASSSDLEDSEARYNAILVEPANSSGLLVWASLIEMFRHAWWTRLWAPQELAAS